MEKDANGNGIVRRTAYRNASTKIREIIKAIRETADRQARTKPECAVRRTKSAANGTKQSAVLRRRHSDRDTTTTNKRERTDVKNSTEDVREVKRLKCFSKEEEVEHEHIDVDDAKENIMAPTLLVVSTSNDIMKPVTNIIVDYNGNDALMNLRHGDVVCDDIDLQIAVIADCDGDRPIHLAVLNGDVSVVERLLELMKKVGVPIDIRNYMKQTPLHLACISGDVSMASLLLSKGSAIDKTDRLGNTCIHLAVKYRNIQCLLFLLNKLKTEKHVINAVNYDGFTALHLAVINKNENFVKLISAVGADINSQDRKMGRSPLHWSVVHGNLSMTRLLVNLDANLSIVDYTGSVPIMVAQERGLCRITNFLENNMNNSIKFSS